MRPPFVDGQPPPSAASNAPVGQEFRTWCGTTPPTLAISNMLRLQTEYSRSWQTGLDSNSASFRDGRLLLQFLAVVLSQLRNFRLDHYPAIGLSGILGVIILVIILRFVEVAIGYHLGDDRFLPDFRLVELLDNLTGNLFLFWVVKKNSRGVRGPHITPRGVLCCRVGGRKEYL